jgi:hypothetical protein
MKRLPLDFSRFRATRSQRNELPLRIKADLRQAQLSGVPLSAGVVCFSRKQVIDLESFRPHVLIGLTDDLERVAEQVALGIADLSSVDHAILALTSCGEPPIGDKLRVVLWQTFGVPVFELLIAPDGAVLAADCQAHEGWHLQRNARATTFDGELLILQKGRHLIRTGLTGQIETERCPCGRSTPRINGVQVCSQADQLSALAATA